MLDHITPLILTWNEAPNIARTLERVSWAKRILVVDSFSTDDTLKLVAAFPQVQVLQRKFDSFASQCNFGLEHISTPWVLSLDADYVLSQSLVDELRQLPPTDGVAGYTAQFRYCIFGKPLRASLYPPRTVLYRKAQARYSDVGHGHRVFINGPTFRLSSPIDHDDRKPLDRWLAEQNKYAIKEALHLLSTPPAQLNRPDRIRRRIVLAPALVFLYTLLAKGLILDGLPGWHYVFQRTLAETLLSLRLLEARLSPKP